AFRCTRCFGWFPLLVSPVCETFHVNPFLRPVRACFRYRLIKARRAQCAVMTPVSSFQSSALSILQRAARPLAENGAADPAGVNLVATANGVAPPRGSGGAGPTQQAKAKVSEALFKPNAPSVLEMKLHLMKRLGEEFGIKLEDHETNASFGRAIQSAIAEIKMKPGGSLVLSAIERKLGFDKLGFSLDTFVNAIIDPNGSDGQSVDAALKEHLGKTDEDEGDGDDAPAALESLLGFDENGL